MNATALIASLAAFGGGGFTTDIDNPYWPMRPGSRWVYRETAADGTRQRIVVTVTRRIRRIANGVDARVVRDVVTERGKVVERTDDWYAQDRRGNVWYLGERTSGEGSWEAGVDGARPGIAMLAHPRRGIRYRQEHYKGHAEDRAIVYGTREQVQAPFGHFRNALMTKDLNPLEPRVVEFKFYARGIGPVLAIATSGGSEREELLRYTRGG